MNRSRDLDPCAMSAASAPATAGELRMHAATARLPSSPWAQMPSQRAFLAALEVPSWAGAAD